MIRYPLSGDWSAALAEREAEWDADEVAKVEAEYAGFISPESCLAAFAVWIGLGALATLALVLL